MKNGKLWRIWRTAAALLLAGWTGCGIFALAAPDSNLQDKHVVVEGPHYKEGHYRGDVTVSPGEGYVRISENGTDFEEKLTYTASLTGNARIYLEKEDGERMEAVLEAFAIDRTVPSDVACEVETEEWAQSKRVRVATADTDGEVELYYSAEEKDLSGGVDSEEDLAGLVRMEKGKDGHGFYVSQEIGEEPISYFVYAVDEAGNVGESMIEVSRIDASPPRISGLETAYTKAADDLTVEFTADDALSGIVEAASDSEAAAISGRDGTYRVDFKAPGRYQVTVTDWAGNCVQRTVEVEQDSEVPRMELTGCRNDAGYTVADSAGIYYFGEELTVRLLVKEDAPQGEDISTGILISRNGVVQAGGIVGTADGVEWTDRLTESGTFVYQIRDEAGNGQEEALVIKAQKSDSIPSIRAFLDPSLSVTADGFLNRDPDIRAELEDAVGIARLEYREKGQDAYRLLKDFAGGTDGVAAGKTTRFDGVLGELEAELRKELTDMADGAYAYGFRVTNVLGRSKEEEVSFKIDKTAPEETIYVEYRADEDNPKWSQDFLDFVGGGLDWLFGRQKIRFRVYARDGGSVEDAASGIDLDALVDSISLKHPNARLTAEKEQGMSAIIHGRRYSYVAGSVELRAEKGSIENLLQIEEYRDRAGNVARQVSGQKIEGSTILFLDNVPPRLTVEPEEGAVADGSTKARRIFYRKASGEGSRQVALRLEEEFYDRQRKDGKIVNPKVEMIGGQAVFSGWKREDGHEGFHASARLELPFVEGEEAEYRFTVQYQDGSGNRLTGENQGFGSFQDGAFVSACMILDDKAPMLTAYSVKGETDRRVDGLQVYHNKDGDDVEIAFTIEDCQDYWNPEAVDVLVRDTGGKAVMSTRPDALGGKELELSWESREDSHTAVFMFDGEIGAASGYQVLVAYKDRAGNPLKAGTGLTRMEAVGEGQLAGEAFILDHTPPRFRISYSEAFRLVDGKGNDYSGPERTPMEGMASYYGAASGKIAVFVALEEDYLAEDRENPNGIADFSFRLNGVETELDWTESGAVRMGNCEITADGDYIVSASYRDAAGNQMMAGAVVQGGKVSKGFYVSPVLILDTEPPKLSYQYDKAPANVCEERKYFSQDTVLKLRVEDQNIRYKELKDVLSRMEAVNLAGKDIHKDTSAWKAVRGLDRNGMRRGTWENIDIPLFTDANYTFPIGFTDLAGNASELDTIERCTKDSAGPSDLSLSYSFNNPVDYGPFGFLFAQRRMAVIASVKDKTAGVHTIRFTVAGEKGEAFVREKTAEPTQALSYQVELPIGGSDFKGTVKVEALDWADNRVEETRGHIVESAEMHESTHRAAIETETKPSRTVDGVDFYNTDVNLRLSLKDAYSGIRSFSYSGGNTLSGSWDYAEEAGTKLAGNPQKSLVYEHSENLTLEAASNNENNVLVKAEFMDNAGHTGSVEQRYHIDVTVPTLTIEYDLDNPAGGRFYSQERTATVRVRERNFDAEDVELTITNTDGAMPLIGGWKESGSGDDTEHECQIVFCEDGDYTFTAAFEDMAGNKADYSRVDEFTIDRTKPELTVAYDGQQCQNGLYYAKGRTATIDILEHNFEPSLVDVLLEADGAPLLFSPIWQEKGDHHVATVEFTEDGDYTFRIAGKDQAENPFDDYGPDHFIIDQTPPKLEILGIEDRSANKGVVVPEIRCSDTNYDPGGMVAVLSGCHNGTQELDGAKTDTSNGTRIKLEDFEHIPQMDDLYRLEVSACDLAGNRSEAEVHFSVNRFGSVYTFDGATEGLAGEHGAYYTKEEQDIVVIETNVDELSFREITCSFNGALRTLEEGEEYEVLESRENEGWKQYTYRIPKRNFEEEGVYRLNIYSEDRASNASDNGTKGKQVEFAVDKTAPSILVSGVEDGGQYRESERKVTLDVQDNICLAGVEVDVDGEKTAYSKEELSRLGGRPTFTIGGRNRWRSMRVRAYDAAGNEQCSEEIRFLVTTSFLMQLFMSRVPALCAVGLLTALGAVFWRLLKAHRRKPRE